MNYLYHRVPKNLEGRYLMPLNQLKKKYPEVYKEHVKKYEGRMHLMNEKIPVLNCLWNDVLHMIAVPPSRVYSALVKSGWKRKEQIKWFKINPELLGDKNALVFLYKEKTINLGNKSKKQFVKFKINDLKKYDLIRKRTKDYYKREFSAGRTPLAFHMIPHILYKGKLKISDLEVIEI